MARKHTNKAPVARPFGPLVTSTLRQERRAFVLDAERSDPHDVLIASYNIHKCVGLDGIFSPRRILSVIREIDADVIALQEVDARFGMRDGLLDLAAIEQECGLRAVPVQGVRNSHGWHGNIILVRNGIVRRSQQIVLPGIEPRGALIADIDLAAGPMRVIGAHFGLLRRSRALQVEEVLKAAETEDGRPALLLGDLNEWRLGPRSSLRGLAPVFGPLHADVASFPARFPVWSLDRILANPHDIVGSIHVHDTPLARVASDHLPIKATLRLGTERNSVASAA